MHLSVHSSAIDRPNHSTCHFVSRAVFHGALYVYPMHRYAHYMASTYVCMYVFMYVCMYVLCICVRMYYVCTYIYIYSFIY